MRTAPIFAVLFGLAALVVSAEEVSFAPMAEGPAAAVVGPLLDPSGPAVADLGAMAPASPEPCPCPAAAPACGPFQNAPASYGPASSAGGSAWAACETAAAPSGAGRVIRSKRGGPLRAIGWAFSGRRRACRGCR